jgi:ATP-dependent helicase/nuclease subunit B
MDVTPNLPDPTLTPWLKLAGEGAVLVTSNQRAARFLAQQYTALARAQGLIGWTTPRILTWAAWLSELWREVALHDASAPVLLSASQEAELWRGIIANSEKASPWNEVALAGLTQQAWKLLQQYSDGFSTLARFGALRPDWQQFQRWAAKFSADNHRGGWLPAAQLERELGQRLLRKQWQPPAQIILWGFDELTPAQQQLVTALREVSQVHAVGPSVRTASETRGHTLECSSQPDEIHTAARWARQRLQENPQARLAVITTKAKEDRGQIYRTFSRELPPGSFDFSLGFPLSHFPLVQTACALLRWPWQSLPQQQISALLLSNSLSGGYESQLRMAEFDRDKFLTRDTTDSAANLEQFAFWLRDNVGRAHTPRAPELLRRCQQALQLKRKERDSADNWADRFRKILSSFRAPVATSSADFQTLERWERLLDDFSALSFNGAEFSMHEALERLQKMADETPFQPESAAASVEILGPLEAAGSLFDGIFFLDCTEDRWPIPVSPNPLLSLDLQQQHAMPGAIRGANLAAAKRMTERLLSSAPEVFFSYPTHGPEGEVRPSPVLNSLEISSDPPPAAHEFLAKYVHPQPQLVASDDLHPVAWEASRRSLWVAALRSQAACPFQAFANQRLGASDFRFAEDGLDALQRGNLLHDLLHAVWFGRRDQPDLPGMGTSQKLHELAAAGELENFVRERAEALVRMRNSSPWEREFLIAERERITALVYRWLIEVEMGRPHFDAVQGEQTQAIAIETLLNLNVRLDRVDKLQSNEADAPEELVLLDYKTGEVDLKGWRPPRLDEPQLPLYADFAITERPVAVAFASVRTGKTMGLQGLAKRGGILPGVDPSRGPLRNGGFDEVLDGWRADILELAREFAAGESRVCPKYGRKTCEYCGLQSLCRVAESGILLRDETDTDGDSDD